MAKPKNAGLKDKKYKFPSGKQNIQYWIGKISSSRGRHRSTNNPKSADSLSARYSYPR